MILDRERELVEDVFSSSSPARYRFGPLVDAGATTFRLWAPSLKEAQVVFADGGSLALQPASDGFLVGRSTRTEPGTRYRFKAGSREFPDLASRQQDGDSAGWSIVRAPMPPSDRRTPLRPWHQTVICEVHVGTATPEGTFSALRERLEHFRDAGYTCLEIMPINEFPGGRNWGYDGTLIFAPEAAYGSPEELRALVDRAHELGLCMVLDVVYNHFGEVDNFVTHYAPEWFDAEVETPWGPGINFNHEMVRQFYYENASMWLTEYDFDGLRFDGVHEMKSDCRDLFLGELASSARAAKHHAKLIMENVDNAASWLERTGTGEPLNFTAQWNDDIHHVLEFLVTGEARNGYEDGSRDAVADLEKALADGFVNDGEAAADKTPPGAGPASRLPPDSFISFVQNHDQIGNRPDGRRLPDRISAAKLDFLHFLAFLAPQIPMFFMGEEAHLRSGFPYFVDLSEAAARAKQDDRYRQMKEIFNQDVADGDLPDPNDPATFHSAKLPWEEFELEERRAALHRFRRLAGFRRDMVWPVAATICLDAVTVRQGNCLIVNWRFESGTLSMALNPSDRPMDIDCLICSEAVSTGEFSQNGPVLRLGAWSAVAWQRGDH